MNVTPFLALVIVFSLLELLILGGVLFFYLRLRRSETLLNTLQGNQESLLARIEMNARLEREIVATFAQRQAELRGLDEKLEERAQELRTCWNRPKASAVRRSFCAKSFSTADARACPAARSPATPGSAWMRWS